MSQKNVPETVISIQEQDFNAAELLATLHAGHQQHMGAVVSFTGIVREKEQVDTSNDTRCTAENAAVTGIYLEHYPAMTEKALASIVQRARAKWPILNVVVLHRIGFIPKGEQIVFVGVAASHRKEAFEACSFMMDYLKMEAPFWKKECLENGSEHWVDAKVSDRDALATWS